MANSLEWRWLSMSTPEVGRSFLRALVDIQGLVLYDGHCVRIKRTVLQMKKGWDGKYTHDTDLVGG